MLSYELKSDASCKLTALDDVSEAEVAGDADAVHDEDHVVDTRGLGRRHLLVDVRHAATHHPRPRRVALQGGRWRGLWVAYSNKPIDQESMFQPV